MFFLFGSRVRVERGRRPPIERAFASPERVASRRRRRRSLSKALLFAHGIWSIKAL